jgi:hypothetical protein
MKRAAILIALLVCTLPVCASHRPDDALYLSIILTREEHSRDSNSRTTTITLDGNELSYDLISRGFHAGDPVHKKFRLTAEEIRSIKNLIKARNLLVSDSFQYKKESEGGEPSRISRSFKMLINIRMDGKKSLIELSGPSNMSKIKDEQRYQNPNALVEEIFSIIRKQDDEIGYEGMVN